MGRMILAYYVMMVGVPSAVAFIPSSPPAAGPTPLHRVGFHSSTHSPLKSRLSSLWGIATKRQRKLSAASADGIIPDEIDHQDDVKVDAWTPSPDSPIAAPRHPTQVDRSGISKIFGSVFKLKVTASPPLFRRPWARQPTTTSFSTAWAYDLKEQLLITNSHCVADAVVVNVKKPGNSSLFKGEVLCRSDTADLALVRVRDPAFWEGVDAITMEDADVKLGDLVNVVGYPRGGEKICCTSGVVSRLHFSGDYLSIQIDAAINPGNSGGPVLNENNVCVGVAFRKRVDRGSENIGYIIPVEVINHFLEDYRRHNSSVSMCLQGFELQDMTSAALRESIPGMTHNMTGCLVIDVAQWTNANNFLCKDDVVLSIDGHRLQNDKTVAFRDGDFIPLEYLWSYKFVGDNVTMEVLREGKVMSVSWEMQKRHPILPARPTSPHKYLMVGGLLFLPLSWEILDPDRSTRNLRSFCESVKRLYADEEVVTLSEVFPHQVNDGYQPPRLTRLLSFNDVPVRNLSHLIQLVENCKDDWMRFRVDSNLQQLIVLDARNGAVWSATKEVMSTYSVPYYKHKLEGEENELSPWEKPREALAPPPALVTHTDAPSKPQPQVHAHARPEEQSVPPPPQPQQPRAEYIPRSPMPPAAAAPLPSVVMPRKREVVSVSHTGDDEEGVSGDKRGEM